jgi:tetratricopeptide (TPR) repeat protein
MRAQPILQRAILIGMALLLLLAIRPESGLFPSDADRLALERASESGADLLEWQLLARFVSADPTDGESWERMGILDHRSGLCQQAVYEFERASLNMQLSDHSLVPYGECLVILGNLQGTVDLLAPRLETAENSASVALLLSRVYLRLGDLVTADRTIQIWVDREPENIRAVYYLGLLQALTYPDDALTTLQAVAERSIEYENAYRQLQTAINKGELQENPAYQALELGRAYGSLEEWELAFFAFNSAVQLDPEYAEAHAWLGETHYQLGEDGSAELEKALMLNPKSILAQAMQALALQRQGDARGALAALQQIASQEPDDPQWAIAVGQARAQLGDLEGALSEYSRATLLEPENVAVWQAMAEFSLSYQYQVIQVGSPAANKSVLLAPDSPRSLDLAGQAALSKGDLDEAEGYFRAALQYESRYAPAHLHLALVLFQRQDNDAAYEELQKAAALGNIEAQNLLAQMSAQ